MTPAENKIEHKYYYDEICANMCFFGEVPAWAHNMAVIGADTHMANLRREEREEAIRGLSELKATL